MDNTFDRLYYEKGELLGGIDEAGVVDIAGPLVAACVILPKFHDITTEDLRIFNVNDSKKIHEKYRKPLAEVVWECALGIGVGEVQPAEMDFLGKRKSTILAMMRAVAACKTQGKKPIQPDFLLVDGQIELPSSIPFELIKEGDAKSLCVAAASIIAKVYRDNVMASLHQRFPWYGWNKNKGFPCENQFKGMDAHGIQVGIHRTKFYPFAPSDNEEKKHEEPRWRYRRGIWRQRTLDSLGCEAGEHLWKEDKPTEKEVRKSLESRSSRPSLSSKLEPQVLEPQSLSPSQENSETKP